MGDRRRVVLREHARRGIEAAVDSYRDEAGEATALRFVIALETAKYRRPVVLDARGLAAPAEASLKCLAWWSGA